MNHITKPLTALLAAAFISTGIHAQTNGSNSSYSRFGMGMLSDQSQGANRSMGGVAQGLRSGNRLNMLNPASYAAIDSLSFIFDIGMSMQRTAMKQAGTKLHVNNTSIDFVNAGFRIQPGLGMSIGFVPLTSIGYAFSQEQKVGVDDYTQQNITRTSNFTGSGGLHQIYAGVGWETTKHLSIGANIGFLWGNVNHALTTAYAENSTNNSSYNTPNSLENASLKTWKADIGLQYQKATGIEDFLTIGATVGIGHDVGGDATLLRFVSNGDSVTQVANKPYQLPMTYSIGFAWQHRKQWTLAADYTLEQWGNCTAPAMETGATALDIRYVAAEGSYSDRHKVSIGAEYVPKARSNSYGKRISYRMGASYATPYLKINGEDGPKELALTAGIGLPILNRWNSRSCLNIGVQWVHREPSVSNMITENYFRLNLGVTFNDQWFKKWQFK